jgi:hypothetical protein
MIFMTDSLDTETQGSPVDAVVSAGVPSEDTQSRSFDNETVQKIVARERLKAYEKGKQEAMMQLEQNGNQGSPQSNTHQAPSSIGGIAQISPEDIQRMIAEQMPQHLQNHINEVQTRQSVD